MTDKEYLAYLKTKDFEELEDIFENFNKSQNAKRYEVIKKFLDAKRKAEPGLYQEHEKKIRYKTIGPRIGAAVIDGIISWVANWLGALLPVKFNLEGETAQMILTRLSHALWGIIILFPMIRYGATLGMQFAKIRLYAQNEEESSQKQRFTREAIFVLPLLVVSLFPQLMFVSWVMAIFWIQLLLITLGNPIFIYFDAKHRGINDLISKTVILRLPKNT
jgi:uncharacterized RDD family membrane protein YckC